MCSVTPFVAFQAQRCCWSGNNDLYMHDFTFTAHKLSPQSQHCKRLSAWPPQQTSTKICIASDTLPLQTGGNKHNTPTLTRTPAAQRPVGQL